MNIDRYTKLVLTVIAGALVWICALLSGSPLGAQQITAVAPGRPQPVVIVGWGTMTQTGAVSVEWVRDARSGEVRTRNTLPVRVENAPTEPLAVTLPYTAQEPMPVGLTSVKPGRDWEPIRTKAEPELPRATPGIGAPRR